MKTNTLARIVLTGLCAMMLTACQESEKANTTPATVEPAIDRMAPVTLADWPTVRNRYLGKILVADLWASWCISCIERFPAMVELRHRYREQGVQFISLNLDDPTDAEALQWSNKFLQKMNADFPHYHMQENLMKSFEALNLLGIPVVLVFDSEGTERFRLTGDNPNRQFGEKDVEDAIQSLL
ncbi:MAG: TlpA family protein disulfide reductase [Gammaproteobacteria bacterium]|jgi:thiol-disulfide isomerase/thioredoxin|nr:TlpA family protein disulfide reductase [Gammaproteobacteria bacterium]